MKAVVPMPPVSHCSVILPLTAMTAPRGRPSALVPATVNEDFASEYVVEIEVIAAEGEAGHYRRRMWIAAMT